jgi:hypothetical protein
MLHRRKMYFLFDQNQLIRMHPHPSLPAPTGRRLQPPIWLATTDKEAPTPSPSTNLPLNHPTTLDFLNLDKLMYQLFYCISLCFSDLISSLIHTAEAHFFSTLFLIYIFFKMV